MNIQDKLNKLAEGLSVEDINNCTTIGNSVELTIQLGKKEWRVLLTSPEIGKLLSLYLLKD